VEFSYLAFSRFGWDPTLSWERFIADDVAPLVGGPAAAERYLGILEVVDGPRPVDGAPLRSMVGDALDGAAHPDDGVSRRWVWLAERLNRLRYEQDIRPRG